MLDNIYDDSIEYPFLEKNYNAVVKNFSFSLYGLIYQQDILLAIGESGSVKNKLLNKWLSYNTTTQEQIKEIFENIKNKKDYLVDKKYAEYDDSEILSGIISQEKDKFKVEEIFDRFKQFDALQHKVQHNNNFSMKKYRDVLKKIRKIDSGKDIPKSKIDNIMKQYPIRRSDFIESIDNILSHNIVDKTTLYLRVRNFIETSISTIYNLVLQSPEDYDKIMKYVKLFYLENSHYDEAYFKENLMREIQEFIQRDRNPHHGGDVVIG